MHYDFLSRYFVPLFPTSFGATLPFASAASYVAVPCGSPGWNSPWWSTSPWESKKRIRPGCSTPFPAKEINYFIILENFYLSILPRVSFVGGEKTNLPSWCCFPSYT